MPRFARTFGSGGIAPRLERGSAAWPKGADVKDDKLRPSAPALGFLLDGIDMRDSCKRPWYELPYYRQSEIFSRQGVSFHRKTLCDWAALGADWLALVYCTIQHEHWRSRYRQFDETPIDYLEPGSGKAQADYRWASNIPGGTVI